ncbi:FAD-dependent monooxygenase [Pedobacter gandavensis]|uniref:Pentachlorophenol monooxygenase n=1 Tax=Pedobacter gandavensis TaxID=2679963 RepID=A0ABR6ES59_9SPHI|nr:FAD-dependent monooxygenase [Pedobacter gandavensis]MBB2148084.1 pentachlorophenol monooxygenase [Pedobacter gandavensis]
MERAHEVFKTQVIIVGAGPTGLSMAAQLLRYGIDFIIIEKKVSTTVFSKALVVQARTLEIFQELGIAKKAVAEGAITTALNLFYRGKRKAALNFAGLGEGLSSFPFPLSLEQSKTESLLVDHLSANGINIQWQSELLNFEQNEAGVTAFYKDNSGKAQQVVAQYLVGCDGASSLIRHQLGLSFDGDTVPKLFYVADVKLNSRVIHKNELFMFLIKKGFILFFPMEGHGHYRIVGVLPKSEGMDVEFKFADIQNSIIEQVNVPLAFEEVMWYSSYKVHSRKASSFENGRCYIAGDAAHIHTPAGGQGMNTGIQDAYNLAWKMAFTIKGVVNAQVLSSYNTERIDNAKHLLQTTDRLFDIMSGTNPIWNFFRLNFMPPILGLVTKSAMVKKRFFPLISQTAISYPNSFLTVESQVGKVKAGVRMPYFTFSDGKDIFSYLSDPAFKVLFFGTSDRNNFKQDPGGKMTILECVFNEIPAAIFGKEKDFYVLLRPDNHISYLGKDLNRCYQILDSLKL